MPDVIVYHSAKDWLLLVEAVTSHGPVDAKRRSELMHLFREVFHAAGGATADGNVGRVANPPYKPISRAGVGD